MTPATDPSQRPAFAVAVAARLRQSRKDQRLTQTEVASRTGGVVTKAALANYETGHRSIRIDVFWAITKALGEDPGAVMSAAERAIGYGTASQHGPVVVDVDAIEASDDPRLAPVRRWFAMRVAARDRRSPATPTITLDDGAINALAELMGVSTGECRQLLADAGSAGSAAGSGGVVAAGAAGSAGQARASGAPPAAAIAGEDDAADGTASYPFASAG